MLEVARITGGRRLQGTVRAAGSKNACLPILAACLLTRETVTLRNVPDLSDVRYMAEILRHQGAEVSQPAPGAWVIRAEAISHRTPYDLVRKMRASICLLGALVGRLRQAEMAIPGGCVIGPRPIDLHLKGLEALGCAVSVESGLVQVDAARAQGATVHMGGPMGSTVLGTANLVMAAALTPGLTRIECAAREPEVVDLCTMLTKMGARIRGQGTGTIEVEGVTALHGCEHAVIADRIETGTYLVAGAITDGDVTVTHCEPTHLTAFIDKLREAGVQVEVGPDSLRAHGRPTRAVEITTEPYPGFPTDLQAQFMALQLLVDGRSLITEKIYPARFMHAAELQRMGADIAIEGATAAIQGGRPLSGAPVMASDLRASAALILAALVAKGETWVQRLYHLDRGYEAFDVRLASLGAEIQRLPASQLPSGFAEE
ncbi:MAG: UDP-N-acetylglucosamine 1-carboxyvinyltransferase [Opitutales bacterium]|jgi:UDP-N-acetylglucosamine 1-carboxyvinyltransferase